MADIVWPESILEVVLELPERERDLIIEKAGQLARSPRMYPVRPKGRFRRHRWFLAGNWIVYYRVLGDTVFMRGIWPARLPQ